ncbi:MAG: immune inhibitor A [Kofleriaceae bacterium]|nr:immune inhibitor A [Kofleriaceae bacterium]
MRQIPVIALAIALAACAGDKSSGTNSDDTNKANTGANAGTDGESKTGNAKGHATVSKDGSATKADDSPEARMVANLAGLHIDKLGNPVLRWDHIPPVIAAKEAPHKLLVLLVEYSDRKFDRFSGDPDQASKLSEYYQEQLFDDSYAKIDTLSHYYRTQSLGKYHVVGQVMKPITLPKDRSYYGSPHRPAGGNWRNDSAAEELIADALKVAHSTYKDLDWSDFDRWDPEDYDKDKKLDEGDGYLDHFVIVFAGGGQSSCEGLHKVGDVLTSNVQMKEGLKLLSKEQRECADRIWPHRSKVKANDGTGPKLGGIENPGGGLPVSDTLWIRDYNAQSEYTGASTFIHEFGHSIGLPDVYSRTSSNSTGGWEVMSGTASPSPQNMSSWSRLMLGWLKPKIITPPAFGGAASVDFSLRTLDDPADVTGDAERAAMIILPPKKKKIELTALPEASGKWALYSGQGNELSRTATLQLDLSKVTDGAELSFDAWWEIEPGWDFAYLELSADGGKSWQRKLPTDSAHMPAKHGHDGKTTLPGFTGLSGDLDGDGKNESNADCDPKA